MKLPCFITLICLLLSFNAMQSMVQNDANNQNALDMSLLNACKNFENPITWSELTGAAFHCTTVTARRLTDIKKKVDAGANPNKLIPNKAFTAFHWAVANNSPKLVAFLLNNRANAHIPFDRTKQGKPPITTVGMTLVNYVYIENGEFNIRSLRHSQAAKDLSLDDARKDNLAIKHMLMLAGVAPQGEDECRVAQLINTREDARRKGNLHLLTSMATKSIPFKNR